MRLVDADERTKAIEHRFCDSCNKRNDVQCKSCNVGDILDMLDDAPTVDAVEVVRCKDCENSGDSVIETSSGSVIHCSYYARYMCIDHFCKHGTPKEANT